VCLAFYRLGASFIKVAAYHEVVHLNKMESQDVSSILSYVLTNDFKAFWFGDTLNFTAGNEGVHY
jgi:hypothetical protein